MLSDSWKIHDKFSEHGQIQKDSLFEKLEIDSSDFNNWIIYIPSLNITYVQNEGLIHFGIKLYFKDNSSRRIIYFKSFLSSLNPSKRNSLLSNREIYFESFPKYRFLNIYFLPQDISIINTQSTPIHQAINEIDSGDYFGKDSYSLVKRRAKQAKWRADILHNYQYECSMPACDINIPKLLEACHIKEYNSEEDKKLGHRAHPQNGICFCTLCHKLFDNGYFSLTNDFKIEISQSKQVSSKTINELLKFSNSKPISYIPSQRLKPLIVFINYHRMKWGYKT